MKRLTLHILMLHCEKSMNHRLTFRQYRQMDLTVFGAMLVVAEALIVLAATRWFPAEAYTVSIVAAVTSIVLMRWGPWARQRPCRRQRPDLRKEREVRQRPDLRQGADP